jgi:hypothetical protein
MSAPLGFPSDEIDRLRKHAFHSFKVSGIVVGYRLIDLLRKRLRIAEGRSNFGLGRVSGLVLQCPSRELTSVP